jgi:putative PEP-CTERM system TPR-repeat lipoprotein
MKYNVARLGFALFASASAITLLCGVIPAAAALPPTGGASSNAAVARLVSDAQNALKAGKLPLAIIDLKNATSADPHNGNVRAQLGAALMKAGDYRAAEQELRDARRQGAPDQIAVPPLLQVMLALKEEKVLLDEFPEPTSGSKVAPDILKARALALLSLGQTPDAIDAMDRSLRLRKDVPGLLLRARIALKAGAPSAALQFTNDAISMEPNNLDASLFKEALLLDTNNLDGALAIGDQIVAKYPANLPAQFSRIDVLMRLRRDDQAKAAVDAILAKSPALPLGIYYRALLLARAGDNKDAWRTAQSLPQAFLSSQSQIALIVSRMAEMSGRSDTAAAILGAAMNQFPSDEKLRLGLAALRLRQNDMKGAQNVVQPLRDQLDPATAQALATMYLGSNKPDLALDVLQKLAQSGKGTDATTLQISGLEARMGQSDQALKDLSDALDKKPNDAVLADQLLNSFVARGRFADALGVADKLGRDPTQRVLSLALRGEVFLAENKLDDALASYDQAIKLDPKSEFVLYGSAIILERMQRFDEAAKHLQALLEVNPKSVRAYLKLAEIAAQQNQDKQVRDILLQAIQQIPQDPTPRVVLARYLAGRNDQAGARNVLNDLLKAQPNNTEGLTLLGGLELATGKKADAVATYRRLVTLAPRAPASQMLLSNALFISGDRAGANIVMKNAVDLAKTSAEVRQAQINLLFAEKDGNGAVAAAQAFQKANSSTQADVLLGDTLRRAGHRDQAMVVYQKSFSARPVNSTLLRIAETSIANGDAKSAADTMSGWIKNHADDNVVRLAYASLLMQQGNNDDATAQFREILKTDPNNVPSLNNLAWLTRNEDPKDALIMADKAANLAPKAGDVLDTLGWLKLKQGKAADSLSLLKRAHDLRPQDGEVSYHLALSLDATGSHDAAKGFLKALLASQVKFNDLAEANKLVQTWQ